MPKVRVTLTATAEYDLRPEWYPSCASVADMVAMEKSCVLNNPAMLLDYRDVDMDVNVEVIEQ